MAKALHQLVKNRRQMRAPLGSAQAHGDDFRFGLDSP
jgi:hypothetical protein